MSACLSGRGLRPRLSPRLSLSHALYMYILYTSTRADKGGERERIGCYSVKGYEPIQESRTA